MVKRIDLFYAAAQSIWRVALFYGEAVGGIKPYWDKEPYARGRA